MGATAVLRARRCGPNELKIRAHSHSGNGRHLGLLQCVLRADHTQNKPQNVRVFPQPYLPPRLVGYAVHFIP